MGVAAGPLPPSSRSAWRKAVSLPSELATDVESRLTDSPPRRTFWSWIRPVPGAISS
jgi:hypothetical protein